MPILVALTDQQATYVLTGLYLFAEQCRQQGRWGPLEEVLSVYDWYCMALTRNMAEVERPRTRSCAACHHMNWQHTPECHGNGNNCPCAALTLRP